jgi:hypothetical protein
MKYGDSLLIGVDQYLMCQPRITDGSRHVIDNISTKQVVDRGFVTPNNCRMTLPSECVALSWAGLGDFIYPRGRRGGGSVGIGFIDFQMLWEG